MNTGNLERLLQTQHPGTTVRTIPHRDGFYVRVPGVESFVVSALETMINNNDQVLELVKQRIKLRMEHKHA